MNVKFLELIHLGLLPGHTWCSPVTVAEPHQIFTCDCCLATPDVHLWLIPGQTCISWPCSNLLHHSFLHFFSMYVFCSFVNGPEPNSISTFLWILSPAFWEYLFTCDCYLALPKVHLCLLPYQMFTCYLWLLPGQTLSSPVTLPGYS